MSPRRRSTLGFDTLRLEGALLRPDLLTTPDAQWRDLLEAGDDLEEDWQSLALRGGLPTPVLELTTPEDRAVWSDGYVRI